MALMNVDPSSTMTTTSMTKMSSDTSAKSNETTAEEIYQKMKSNLIRYARSNDRRMVLRSLKDVKMLKCLSLDVAQPADGPLFDLEKEVATEDVVFNGVAFRGNNLSMAPGVKDTVTNGVKNSCIPMLKALCRELCDRQNVGASSREIYEKLVVRLAKTTASADPYFRLNSLLGSPDLLVMPWESKMSVTPKALSLTPKAAASVHRREEPPKPIELNLYEANGDIHMTLTQTYKFGLLRKSDVKSNRPWVVLDTVVSERANLSTNTNARQLNVVSPDMY